MGMQMPITIARVIESIQAADYILPSIQREFVWSINQIEKLFDSLMRGYPIGSFLFWQIKPETIKNFQFYRFMDKYHEKECTHNEPIELVGGKSRTAILDGQQRLTALSIGVKGWYAEKLPYYRWSNPKAYPKKQLYLNLLTKPNGEGDMAYDFRMLQESDTILKDDKNYWFPVGQILEFNCIEEVFEYCVDNGLVNRNLKYPSNTLVRLWQVIVKDPVISYFLEEDHDLDKVLNIFIRVNSGGTELSYSDMLLSIATAQWKKLDAREEIYSLVDALNSDSGETYNFSKDFILKACLVLSDIKAIEFKVDNFNRENMLRIEAVWKDIVEALSLTAKLLASWGYNRDTLVSNNSIIPLSYYIYKKGNPRSVVESSSHAKDREKMRRWLSRALLKQTFSGTPDNVLRKIREVIAGSADQFPESRIYEALAGTSKAMGFDKAQIDALLDYRYSQSMVFTILSTLYPWLKYDQNFHIDHIFPRAMFNKKRLEKLGIPKDGWEAWLEHKDDLANLQLLQGRLNQNKSDKEFEAWLKESNPKPDELEQYKRLHLIPDSELTFERFPEFLNKRTEIIRRKLEELLCA
jgi:hypothetical protein